MTDPPRHPGPPPGPPPPGGQGPPNPWAPRGPGEPRAGGALPAPGTPPRPFGYGPPPGLPPQPPVGAYGGRPPTGPPRPPYAGPPPPAPDGRLGAALIGALVGAVVAALIAAAIVTLADDGPSADAPATTTGAELDIQQLLETAEPSVVAIESQATEGSGFVISADGLIVTNDHVIAGASDLEVVFVDGRSSDATLVGSFPDEDVAMIRVEDTEGLVPARLGSSDALEVGDDVVAIGNALGLGVQPSVTLGIVSAKDRSIETEAGLREHLIQTDAAINPGNSGGPLVNAQGEVVGINTANIPGAQNIGFALAIDAVRPLLEELRAGRGEVNEDTAFLGISSLGIEDPSLLPSLLETYDVEAEQGAFILEIVDGSSAQEAGLQRGDVIVEADGESIQTSDDVARVMRGHEAGDRIPITYERRGERRTIEVTLGRR